MWVVKIALLTAQLSVSVFHLSSINSAVFCQTLGIMNSLCSRIHSHLWAEAKHRKIEFINTSEKQVAMGERENHVLGFQVMPFNVNAVIYYISSLVRYTVDLTTTF